MKGQLFTKFSNAVISSVRVEGGIVELIVSTDKGKIFYFQGNSELMKIIRDLCLTRVNMLSLVKRFEGMEVILIKAFYYRKNPPKIEMFESIGLEKKFSDEGFSLFLIFPKNILRIIGYRKRLKRKCAKKQ